MRLFAYCLMDNHYHLVLKNASGRMSGFFRALNTHYAIYYRQHHGGRSGATVRAESGSKSVEIEVTVDENQLPSAEFSISPDNVKVGETVYFNGGLSSDLDGRVVNWEWSFGDGASGRGEKASHNFGKPGAYTVTLKVSDNAGGSDACEETVTITE